MNRWILLLCTLAAVATPLKSQTIKVEGGLISGATSATPGVREYEGVPYAAPPVGNLRWRAPGAVAAWQGVRKAEQLPPMCMQTEGAPNRVFYWGHQPVSEDCLYLNVWTPAGSDKTLLPVMVWFHGGAFTGGWSGSPFFNGEHLAAQGVVVVTVNYRLGVLGFLAQHALSEDSENHTSGNYGMLDQIAALRWVQRNISVFGGDPKRVTIFGQSAGASSVCFLMASPLTKGMFIHAIGESMGCFGEMPTLARAEQAGAKFLAAVNVGSIAELRSKPAEDLLKFNGPYPFRPIVDGYVFAKDTYTTFLNGEENRVPLLVGSNSDEGTVLGTPPETAAAFIQQARQQHGDRADEFLKLFPAGTDAEAKESFYRLQTDSIGSQVRVWKRMLLRSSKPVYSYYFSHKPPVPPGMYREQAIHDVGAFHTAEIVYVFRNLNARPWPWTDEDRKLSELMSAYWVNFAKKGDPNGPGLPKWPAADAKNDWLLEFGQGATPKMREGLDKPALDFVESVLATAKRSD